MDDHRDAYSRFASLRAVSTAELVEEGVSPAEAAILLGTSRLAVSRLIRLGRDRSTRHQARSVVTPEQLATLDALGRYKLAMQGMDNHRQAISLLSNVRAGAVREVTAACTTYTEAAKRLGVNRKTVGGLPHVARDID